MLVAVGFDGFTGCIVVADATIAAIAVIARLNGQIGQETAVIDGTGDFVRSNSKSLVGGFHPAGIGRNGNTDKDKTKQ